MSTIPTRCVAAKKLRSNGKPSTDMLIMTKRVSDGEVFVKIFRMSGRGKALKLRVSTADLWNLAEVATQEGDTEDTHG